MILNLDDPRTRDPRTSGGKGASLARLRQLGFTVPDAVIVTGDTVSDRVLTNFLEAHPDALFGVRSSALDEDGADDSFAGQHETFLNVGVGEIPKRIADCRGSFHSKRALAYRAERDLPPSTGGAVIVQVMLRPDVAGVAFSLDPRNGQTGFVVIEYVAGLGDRLVGGEITPVRVVVRKSTLAVSPGDDPHAAALRQLAVAVSRCAEEWGLPVDVEFTIVGGAPYLLQCRPITAYRTDSRPVFELSFTRSQTIMQQSAWHKVYTSSARQLLGWECPYDHPPTFFHLSDRSVEVWENAEILDWFTDKVRQSNTDDPECFARMYAGFETTYAVIEDVLENGGVADLAVLRSFVDVVNDFAFYFGFLYFSSIDEHTPEPVRSRAIAWRSHDESWAALSAALVASIGRAIPQAKGREIAIVPEDLTEPPEASVLDERLRHFIYIPGIYAKAEMLGDCAFVMDRFALSYPRIDSALLLNNQLAGDSVFDDGLVTGTARIIRHPGDLSTFGEGEILVSPMTTPEFLPAMIKAAAIVTDEGGTLCHAAIVARELKLPCVVGLKVASTLIKTGDTLIVDSQKGLVTVTKDSHDHHL